MRLLFPGLMNDRFTIFIEGVGDASLVTDIERTIRESLDEMVLPGAWRVSVFRPPLQ